MKLGIPSSRYMIDAMHRNTPRLQKRSHAFEGRRKGRFPKMFEHAD